MSMAIVLNDILVGISRADCSFKNPVALVAETGSPIGSATLEHRSDRIYATLEIEDAGKPYTEYYPKAEIDIAQNIINSIMLSPDPNSDERIERIMDQELFQSSPGAANAEMH